MFSAMLFAISIVALSQFGVYYWRAVLAGVAAQPVSDRVLGAVKAEDGSLCGEHFRPLAKLHDLTPELSAAPGSLRMVRAYYGAINAISFVAGRSLPAVAAWAQQEMTICARYVAVQIDRRLQSNLELAASLRSC